MYSTGYENNFVSYDENTITSLGEPYDWGNLKKVNKVTSCYKIKKNYLLD